MSELTSQIYNQISSFSKPISDSPALDLFVDKIVGASAASSGCKVFVYGVGREGLMLNAFCMRLFHLGFSAHVFFNMTTPPISSPDLIAFADSGGFCTVDAICGVTRSNGACVLLTAQPAAGSSAKYATAVIYIPAQTIGR